MLFRSVMIPHYALLANVIQIAHYMGINDKKRPKELQRYPPGSRILACEAIVRTRADALD